MLYKMKNIAFLVLLYIVAILPFGAKAQGIVALSEEAMFDDELESNVEAPVVAPAPKPLEKEPKLESTPEVSSDEDVVPQRPDMPVLKSKDEVLPDSSYNDSSSTGDFSTDLFSQMSELEKRTTLMNLELRREKLQNEIDAVKNQRKQAIQQEKEKAEAFRLKTLEQEKEQERKLLVEQEKLRELDIKFENLRQEKLLGEYKNKMLEENQKWIEHSATFYKQIADLKQSKLDMAKSVKEKFDNIQRESIAAKTSFEAKITAYKKAYLGLQKQVKTMKKRIDILTKERDEARQNPFANAGGASANMIISSSENSANSADSSVLEPKKEGLSQLYAITEIRGQGGELIAKLINKSGTSFYVKKGTTLQSGHVIAEITSTYILAERGDERDYIYFSAGGVLPQETDNFKVEQSTSETAQQ